MENQVVKGWRTVLDERPRQLCKGQFGDVDREGFVQPEASGGQEPAHDAGHDDQPGQK